MTRRLIWMPGDPPGDEPERTTPLVDLWAAELAAAERHAERYRAMFDAYERVSSGHNGYEKYESPEPQLRSEDE